MYTILRKLDDGFGSIHVVQKGEFETLTSLLNTLRDDLKIDIATNIEDGEIQSYIDDNDHNESLYEWVTGWVKDTDVNIGAIANPNGFGNNTDLIEILKEQKLIAKF